MTFREYLKEAGEVAGKLELIKTDLKTARAFAEKVFKKYNRNLNDEIPNFDKNYITAQKIASTGKTLRKDMPVIDEKDIKKLQTELVKGEIDIRAPFANKEDAKDPFPTGLKKGSKKAEEWLTNGLKVHDGSKDDDVVKAKIDSVSIKDLKPIQKQIYFDKSITATAESGVTNTINFLKNETTFVDSADRRIIDGHHRYLSGLLVDPNMKVHALTIDLPIKQLLPLTLSYSDAVGNKRNA